MEAKLKAWEAQLKRQEATWDKKRADRERELVRLDALVLALVSKTEGQRSVYQALAAKTEQLDGEQRELLEWQDQARQELIALEKSKDSATDELEALVREIEERKRTALEELAQAGAELKAEQETRLNSIHEQITERQSHLLALSDDLVIKRAELAGVHEALNAAREQSDREADELSQKLIETKADLTRVEGTLAVVAQELATKYHERDELVATVTKRKEEHERFVKYEKAAWETLNAKDRELQDKQAELDIEERHLSAQRSYLPKL